MNFVLKKGPASALHRVASTIWLGACRRAAAFHIARHHPVRDLSTIAIVAPLGRRNGIGQGARLQYAAFKSAGRAVELVDATAALRNPIARVSHAAASAYVFHCGGPQTANLLHAVLPMAAQAWRIGYWAWELSTPPQDWRAFAGMVSEIWTPSRFAADSLAQIFDLPIRVAPHSVPVSTARRRNVAAPFTVLVMADGRSSLSRKNPGAAIAAFRKAFGDDARARLFVKLNGTGKDVAGLAAQVEKMSNARLITRYLGAAELSELYQSTDVLLSLHRAEGFGLPLLEAMAHGIPVVATGWSGNLEFMSCADSVLVPYRLVPVRDEAKIYSSGTWAEPDIEAAAAALRRLADEPNHYSRLARDAYAAARAAYRRSIELCAE
ncbi:glycosyltransferase [Consotaella salsifontis]|uniref:Glycosyltransferase involved in cell wall bisynthesis n=1 Tax=Consotaella salsifontis TaxID=1365950 RepID=A0A1T4SXR6_9HYPH|nr:glycosyltransferase [Consotaella salsifontis]SKA32922.1 Glycosyltransferase involved in cell wall bisynthesis [Consotaella salsifontis]